MYNRYVLAYALVEIFRSNPALIRYMSVLFE
jgi:hypothetical protein